MANPATLDHGTVAGPVLADDAAGLLHRVDLHDDAPPLGYYERSRLNLFAGVNNCFLDDSNRGRWLLEKRNLDWFRSYNLL